MCVCVCVCVCVPIFQETLQLITVFGAYWVSKVKKDSTFASLAAASVKIGGSAGPKTAQLSLLAPGKPLRIMVATPLHGWLNEIMK